MELSQILHAARIELVGPRAQAPSYRHLLHLGVSEIQSFFNRVANTGRAWTVGETTLTVSSGVDEYQLGQIGIGKVLDVVTFDPNNQEASERQVPFYDLNEVRGDYRGWEWPGASRIAFFRKDGYDSLYARLRAIPTESRAYIVSYSIGTWPQDASLADSPLLSQHHHLIVCRVALAALPAAKWSEDPKADDYMRQSIERSLSRRIETYEKDFNLYIASVANPRNTMRYEAFPIE